MSSATSGAVFFLGARAHYQSLQLPGPGPAVDAENGNDCESAGGELADCSWIHCARSERSGSDMLLLEYHDEPALGNTGITHRFRGKSAQDSLSERIMNDDNADTDSVGMHNLSYRDNVKSKDSTSGRCASLRALLSNLRPRRRKPSVERESHQMCTYKDSCRCLDCQSRYFECDDSDSDYSISSDYNDYFNYDFNPYDDTPTAVIVDKLENQSINKFYSQSINQFDSQPINLPNSQFDSSSTSRDTDDESDEVFIDSPPDNLSTDMLIQPLPLKMSVSSEENDYENPLDLEMAAGTPVVLDYLLNHPITCSLQ